MSFLHWVGVAFQVVGLAVALYGFWRTWHAFAGGEPFLGADAHRRAASARKALGAIPARLARRPRNTFVRAQTAELMFTGDLAIVKVTWAPASGSLEDQMATTDRRLRELFEQYQVFRNGTEETIRSLRSELASARHDVELVRQEMAQITRGVALDGVRIQVIGLGLSLIGFFLVALS